MNKKKDNHDYIFSQYLLFDVHESVHRDIIMNTINEMQLYRLIYYF
jgi:hypothetical protein